MPGDAGAGGELVHPSPARPAPDQRAFSGALSNLEYRIKIADTVTGASRTYTNPQGRFASFADTSALRAD